MSWSWKTKPRSITKTIQWFPFFAALEGEDWNQKSSAVSKHDGKAVHPVRRSYIYSAHSDDDTWLASLSFKDYLSGTKDNQETEANGRMDKGAYEFFGFGYVKKDGRIAVTEVGNKIVHGTFDDEDYLKQLLKLRVPNCVYEASRVKNGRFVFPLQAVLEAFRSFESLNRSELALLFGCDDTKDIPKAMQAIADFKEGYALLQNKNDTAEVKKLFLRVYKEAYGQMKNQADSYYEYAEALTRTLIYTGLFSASGRSIATKIRVAEHSKTKVRMLQEKYQFTHPEVFSLDEYMQWFGSSHNVTLPWENPEERKAIIAEKAKLLTYKMELADEEYREKAKITLDDIGRLVLDASAATDANDLKEYENLLSDAIVSHNEEYFVKVLSKTEAERRNILDKFGDILANEDMSALWLEVNTWKSLIAIEGEQVVKRNFKIEEDLTPKSFAPGVGNTPDMELYKNGYIIVPEVSLMTGVRQWEHEASSVIDHVLSFIKEHAGKQVLGLFLSSRINVRTMWQFFILNRESWVGSPVPVIPLTIEQYIDIIRFIYGNNRDIDDFKALLESIANSSIKCDNYEMWEQGIKDCIYSWKQENQKGS
ncbi:MAG: AlwI family type II restriction endonuclease [Lachnospiraceae bacterium]